MNENPSSLEAARAWLSPFLFLVLLSLVGGCATQNRSVLITPSGTPAQEDAFPRIVAHADQTSTAREGGFDLVVHYAAEQESFVPEAIEALRQPVSFLRQATGLKSSGKIEAYLYPLDPDQEVPHYQPHGRADFTAVFFVTEGEPLLSRSDDRERYLEVLPHELVHTYLSSLPIADRWLEDGLAEYLKRAFVGAVRDELPGDPTHSLTLLDWDPPIVALRRVEWEPWSQRKTNRVLKLRHKDPALAAYLGQQETWNYAAAAELVERWMAAAEEAGNEHPVLDLIRRIRSHDGRVRWDDTRELIQRQTGRTVEELTEIRPEDVSTARQGAWSERDSPELATRVRALRNLTFLGVPDGADATTLLPAFEVPESMHADPYAEETLARAASGAVAAAGDTAAAAAAADLLRTRFGQDAHRIASPSLWEVLADAERQRALEALIDTVQDPQVGLEYREQANEYLETLTGSTTGWSIELSPSARRQAASRWTQLVSRMSAGRNAETTGG